jgi:hypothetical protein
MSPYHKQFASSMRLRPNICTMIRVSSAVGWFTSSIVAGVGGSGLRTSNALSANENTSLIMNAHMTHTTYIEAPPKGVLIGMKGNPP